MAGDVDTISGSAITIDVCGLLNMTATDTISGGSLLVYGTLNGDGTADTIADSSNVTIESGGLLSVSGSLTLSARHRHQRSSPRHCRLRRQPDAQFRHHHHQRPHADSIIVDSWGDADARRHHQDLRRHHHGRLWRHADHGRRRRHHLGQRHHGRCQRHAEHDRHRHDLGRQPAGLRHAQRRRHRRHHRGQQQRHH